MHKTREAWLQAAGAMLRSEVFITQTRMFIIPRFTVAATWPAWVKYSAEAVAATVSQQESLTGLPHVVMDECVDSPTEALQYLTHEMIHVMDNGASGHRGQFAYVFTAIGMVGRRTGSDTSLALEQTLTDVAAKLGPYPNRYLEV